MNKKRIELTFELEQVVNDILAKCNLIGENIRDAGLEDIKASVKEPDNPETRSIINRAVTEAFGSVKNACQRYLTVGRTEDDNKLERLVKSVTYAKEIINVQDQDDEGHLLFTCIHDGDQIVIYKNSLDQWVEVEVGVIELAPEDVVTPKMVDKEVDSDIITAIEYESIAMLLEIPNFNVSVTDHLKSCIHKYIVDYVMGRFLQDLVADKAGEYKQLADAEDYPKIVSALNSREKYTMRKPSFM